MLHSSLDQGNGDWASARRTVCRDSQAGQRCASDLAQRPGHHVLGLKSAGVAHGVRPAVLAVQEQLHGGAAARRMRACAQASSVCVPPPRAVPLPLLSETSNKALLQRTARRALPSALCSSAFTAPVTTPLAFSASATLSLHRCVLSEGRQAAVGVCIGADSSGGGPRWH